MSQDRVEANLGTELGMAAERGSLWGGCLLVQGMQEAESHHLQWFQH